MLREQARLDGDRGAAVIVHRGLVEGGGKRRTFQVDVRSEFAALWVPEVLAHVGTQIVSHTLPASRRWFRIAYERQVIIDGDQEHGVVVDIQRTVRAFVEFHAPFVFRLHVAPVRGGGAPDQAVLAVEAVGQHVIEGLTQTFAHRHAIHLLIEDRGVLRDGDVSPYGLDQRGFLVGLYGVLMGQQLRGRRRPAVLVGHVGLRLGDVPVGDVPLGALEAEERQQRRADGLGVVDLERQLDEGVQVANPDFAVTAAGGEAGLEQVPGLVQDPRQIGVGQDLSGQLLDIRLSISGGSSPAR